MARGDRQKFKPVVVYDIMGYFKQLQLAVCVEGEDVTLLMSDTTKPGLFTRDVLVGQIGARYAVSERDPKDVAAQFKERAKVHGATPEAVRLLGLLCPVTKEEANIMAEKKLAPKKGDAEALKTAAKKAPVGGPKTEAAPKKPRGNPEALAKAREQNAGKQAELRAKKIKALKKPKEIEAREGSFRHTMLTDLLSSKTVGEFYDKSPADSKSKYDAGCLRFAEGAGYIELN